MARIVTALSVGLLVFALSFGLSGCGQADPSGKAGDKMGEKKDKMDNKMNDKMGDKKDKMSDKMDSKMSDKMDDKKDKMDDKKGK